MDEFLQAIQESGLNVDPATMELLKNPVLSSSSSLPSTTTTATATTTMLDKEGKFIPASVTPFPSSSSSSSSASSSTENLNPSHRYLRVTLNRGKAFLSHLDDTYFDDDEEEGNNNNDENEEQNKPTTNVIPPIIKKNSLLSSSSIQRYYVLHFLFRGQRMRSQPVNATVEPHFSESFLFDIQPEDDNDGLVPLSTLLSLPSHETRIHIVLTLVTHRQRPVHNQLSTTTIETYSDSLHSTTEVTTDVIGVQAVEWRHILSDTVRDNPSGQYNVLVQLSPVGDATTLSSITAVTTNDGQPASKSTTSSSVPVGLLPLTFDILPTLLSNELISRQDLTYQLDLNTANIADNARTFFTYSKRWWNEYRSIHPTFRRRLVKIFGENELGEFHPVVSYVTPLVTNRAIDSPAEAARFVSLLPTVTPSESIGIGASSARREIWPSLHSIIAAKATSIEGRAVLLCSLLLGFGLDAYVAIGTRTEGSQPNQSTTEEETAWVVTRYTTVNPGLNSTKNNSHSPNAGSPPGRINSNTLTVSSKSSLVYQINCWDPTTGHRCSPGDILPSGACYGRIAVLFSHNVFYACSSEEDHIALIPNWDFDDGITWKGMDPALLTSLPHIPTVPITVSTLDTPLVSNALESVLRESIETYRASSTVRRHLHQTRKLMGGNNEINNRTSSLIDAAATPWDNRLSYLLQQAIAGYETERIYGIGIGNAEFAASVKRSVPTGTAFRAFPIVFNHISPGRIMDSLIASSTARDIIETPADNSTAFAIRVRVYSYAEDTTAAWVMIAVRTRVTQG